MSLKADCPLRDDSNQGPKGGKGLGLAGHDLYD